MRRVSLVMVAMVAVLGAVTGLAGGVQSTPINPGANATARIQSTGSSASGSSGLPLTSAGATVSAVSPAGPNVLYVANVGPLARDEQLLFTALQGLANRDGASIYLLGLDDTAATWLHDVVPPTPTQAVASPYDLLVTFHSLVKGLVVWDPKLAVDTQNLATSWAGLEDLLPVSPDLATKLSAYGFKVKHDLRTKHFTSRTQAYEWALKNFDLRKMPVLAWLNSTLDGTRHNVRDMIVAKRGFVFAASPEHDSYISAKILAAFPYETPVLGYPCINDPYSFNGVPCESFGVGQVSNNGKFVIPSDLGANLTVFSHLALTTTATVPPWNEATPTGFGFPADPTKTYVGFLVSDGDNVGYNMEYLRAHHWVDPARGTIPIGYSISPWLKQFAPRIYDYFVRTLKPDEVLADGPSGAGYMYPGVDPDLSGYLKQAKPLLQQAGLKSVWILDYGYSASPTPFTTQQYVDALHPSVIFTDYPGFLFPNPPAVSFSKGVPVIHALFGGYTPNPVNDTVNQIRLATATANTRPAFVLVALDTWNMGPKEAVQVMNQLGPSYLAVRPDQFVGMIKALGGVNIPESPVMPPPPPTLPPFQLPVCIPGPPPADPGC